MVRARRRDGRANHMNVSSQRQAAVELKRDLGLVERRGHRRRHGHRQRDFHRAADHGAARWITIHGLCGLGCGRPAFSGWRTQLRGTGGRNAGGGRRICLSHAKATARSGDSFMDGPRCGWQRAARSPYWRLGSFITSRIFVPALERVVVTVPLPLGAHGAPLEIRYGQLFAMGLIFLLGFLNYFGVKVGGGVQVVVTIVKVALILLIVSLGLAGDIRPSGTLPCLRRLLCWFFCSAGQIVVGI